MRHLLYEQYLALVEAGFEAKLIDGKRWNAYEDGAMVGIILPKKLRVMGANMGANRPVEHIWLVAPRLPKSKW